MALRNAEEFKASLLDGREVYYRGKLVKDVVNHPVLQVGVRTASVDYEIAEKEENKEFAVGVGIDGNPCSRYLVEPRNIDDLLKRCQLIETSSRACYGFPSFAKEGGSDALNAITVAAKRVDEELGTQYFDRVQHFRRYLQEKDLSVAVAMTDVKGDRTLRPSQQRDPDLYLHIIEEDNDGIIIRGAKAHITSAQYTNEIIVMPTRAMHPHDSAYAICCAVPANSRGLKMISRPAAYEGRAVEEVPISGRYDIMDALVVFDDVFVPYERVFLKGEWQFAGLYTEMFANYHRVTAAAYKYPFLELLLGGAYLMAQANGTQQVSHIKDKLAWLALYAETLSGITKAACYNAHTDNKTGMVYPDPVLGNAAKFYFAANYHDAMKCVQDIAGGIIVTAPAEEDFQNSELHPFLKKYLSGGNNVDGEQRFRIIKLVHDLVASDMSGFWEVTTLHAEGSLMAEKLSVLRCVNFEKYIGLAAKAAGLNV